ncbi:hypothetical protein DLAC_09581 [Tieghemostelium lacteum]|uniref:Uncharacterized protein n=1 Tax=Tieghemostelium lacteum TaxID=361077 RepID=A0A151Z6Q9_TIELA|nr:hypothetical protein DLAC_09581 [Tieghemostelium lacteum]|eukprot:KYQ89618.1 hypothetical protein DLAC_09581 [Tieghemostelium lacteum]
MIILKFSGNSRIPNKQKTNNPNQFQRKSQKNFKEKNHKKMSLEFEKEFSSPSPSSTHSKQPTSHSSMATLPTTEIGSKDQNQNHHNTNPSGQNSGTTNLFENRMQKKIRIVKPQNQGGLYSNHSNNNNNNNNNNINNNNNGQIRGNSKSTLPNTNSKLSNGNVITSPPTSPLTSVISDVINGSPNIENTNTNIGEQDGMLLNSPMSSPNSNKSTPNLPSPTESPSNNSNSSSGSGKKKLGPTNLAVGVLSKEKISLLLMILKQKNHIQSTDQKISIYLSIEELIALILEELVKRKIPLSKCGVRLVGSTASNIISHTKNSTHDFNDIDLNFYLLKPTNFTNLLDLEETVIAREVFRQTGTVISKKEVFNSFFRERVKVLNYINPSTPLMYGHNISNSHGSIPSLPPPPSQQNLLTPPTTPISNGVPMDALSFNSSSLSQPNTPNVFGLSSSSSSGIHQHAINTPPTPTLPTTPLSAPNTPTFSNDVSDDWSLISLGCDGETPKNIDIKFIRKISRAYAFSLDSFHIILDPLIENYQSLLPHKTLDQSYKEMVIPMEPSSTPNISPSKQQTQQQLYSNSNSQNNSNNNNINNSSSISNKEESQEEPQQLPEQEDAVIGNLVEENNIIQSNHGVNQQPQQQQDQGVESTSPMITPTTSSISSNSSVSSGVISSVSSNLPSSNESSPSPMSFSLSPTSSTDSFTLLYSNNSSQEESFPPLSLDSQKSKSSNSGKKRNGTNGKSSADEYPPLNSSGTNNKASENKFNSWNQNLIQKLNSKSEQVPQHQPHSNIEQQEKKTSDDSDIQQSQESSNDQLLSKDDKVNQQSQQVNGATTTKAKKKMTNKSRNQLHTQQFLDSHLPNNIRVKVISIYGNYSKAKNDLESGRLNSIEPRQIRRGIFRYCHELAKGRSSGESSFFDRTFRDTFFTQDLMKPSEFQTTLLKYIKKHKNLAMTFLKILESLLLQPYRLPPSIMSPSPIPLCTQLQQSNGNHASLIPLSSSSLLPIPSSTSTTPSNSTPSSPIIDSDTQTTNLNNTVNNNIITNHPHHHSHHSQQQQQHIIEQQQQHGIIQTSHYSPLPTLPTLNNSPKPFGTLPNSPKLSNTSFYDMFYMEYLNIISYLKSKVASDDIDSLWEKRMI